MKSYSNKGRFNSKAREEAKVSRRNEALKKYINSFPLIIDRSVFSKTEEEKLKLKEVRNRYKNK